MENDNNYNEKELFPPILAVDFDGTLVENEFPNIGDFHEEILDAVKAYQKKGWKIILWTCRTDETLAEAVKVCSERGLIFDAVNDNLPEVQQYFGGSTRKVFANFYWDDRNAALFVDKDKSSSLEPMPLILRENCVLTEELEYGA